MKVLMKVSISSPTWSYAPGDIAEFEDDIALKFIDNGFADKLPGEGAGEDADNLAGN